jgi:hypothetical protein
MDQPLRLSEEFSAGAARLRIDVRGGPPLEHVMDDITFLKYRLADVQPEPAVTLSEPDLLWYPEGDKDVCFEHGRIVFTGSWPAGPIQKVAVAVLAMRMEAAGLHPFHASAVRYRDKTVMFVGGQSNHGKSMTQIEACRRGALLVSTETTVVDEECHAVLGSKTLFIRKRTEGTERADKAGPDRAIEKFFGTLPSWESYAEPSLVDVVVVPDIDGNFDPSLAEMIPYERQYQSFYSLQDYFLLNELLAPGFPMPVMDTTELRHRRAQFVARFADRPFYMVRAANPQVLMDQVDQVV